MINMHSFCAIKMQDVNCLYISYDSVMIKWFINKKIYNKRTNFDMKIIKILTKIIYIISIVKSSMLRIQKAL